MVKRRGDHAEHTRTASAARSGASSSMAMFCPAGSDVPLPQYRFKAFSSLRHTRFTSPVANVELMSEPPKRTDDAARDPSSEPTTEPTPAISVPPAETTGNAPGAGRQRAGWRWPQTTRNRIAAGVGITAAAVAIVAGIFTSGVVAGEHASDGL